MKKESLSLTLYGILGIVMGYASFLLKDNLMSLAMMAVVLYASHFLMNIILKQNHKINWYLSNGGYIYIFIWFISWMLFFNVM